MVILVNNKNENFKFQNFNGKCFIFDPFPRDRKPFFKILPVFRHWSSQIYHIWKSPLGDPLIILPSIYGTYDIVESRHEKPCFAYAKYKGADRRDVTLSGTIYE